MIFLIFLRWLLKKNKGKEKGLSKAEINQNIDKEYQLTKEAYTAKERRIEAEKKLQKQDQAIRRAQQVEKMKKQAQLKSIESEILDDTIIKPMKHV